MPFYAEDAIEKLDAEFGPTLVGLQKLKVRAMVIGEASSSDRCREYLTHGFGRRIGILERCLERTVEIFPPDCAFRRS